MRIVVPNRAPLRQEDMDHVVWARMRLRGHDVDVLGMERLGDCHSPFHVPRVAAPDAIIGMGITCAEETLAVARRWPRAKLYCYCWDAYGWCIAGKHERIPASDYAAYGRLLASAHEVWVPSDCTGRRCAEFWGVAPTRVRRILSACPWWDHPDVHDGGYALNALRAQPDARWGMFERCCEELGIPFVSTLHERDEQGYRDAVAHCRFICAPLDELSTGGLSLMEAYRLGKPVLLSDSPYNGGRDYFGERANYFYHDSEADFKKALKWMWEGTVRHDYNRKTGDHKEWIEAQYSNERFADDMIGRLEA